MLLRVKNWLRVQDARRDLQCELRRDYEQALRETSCAYREV